MATLFRDPLDVHVRLAARYGDAVRMAIGPSRSSFLFSRPEHAEHVFAVNQDNYVKATTYRPLRALIGDGLLTSEGEDWRRRRRLIQPVFSRRDVMRFGAPMCDATQRMLKRWDELPSGAVLNVRRQMSVNGMCRWAEDREHGSGRSPRAPWEPAPAPPWSAGPGACGASYARARAAWGPGACAGNGGEQDVLAAHVAVPEPAGMLGGVYDEGTSVLGEAFEHQRLPIRRPYLRCTVCLVTPRRSAMSCHDQPSSRAVCTCKTSSRSARARRAATARSPTSGSLLVAPSAISSTGSMLVSIC